jgi:hypothetical protein
MATYDVRDWRVSAPGANILIYRPGLQTAGRRSVLSLLLLAVAGFVLYTAGLLPDYTVSGISPAGQQAERQQLHDARTGSLQSYLRQKTTPDFIAATAAGLLALLGLLPLIAAFWESIRLQVDKHGRLVVQHTRFWPGRRSFDRDAFSGLSYGIQEMAIRDRHHTVTDVFWRWFVQLRPVTGKDFLSFYPDSRPNRPGQFKRPPERVAQLGRLLEAWSGHRAEGPFVMEETAHRRGFFGSRTTLQSQPVVTHSSVAELNELPPEMQDHVTAAIGSADHDGTTPAFVYKDRSGRTYNRLEDMPREAIERMQKVLAESTPGIERRTIQKIRIKGPDGAEQVYDSLDDMPPELRRRIERHL